VLGSKVKIRTQVLILLELGLASIQIDFDLTPVIPFDFVSKLR